MRVIREFLGEFFLGIDTCERFSYSKSYAGVVKLVDARDSKSREPQAHVGSIPTSGTNFPPKVHIFSYATPFVCFLLTSC